VDAGAPDLARLVLGGAEVLVVVDDAVVGGGRERVELQGSVGVHVADVGHVVNVVSGGQVPAQDGVGGAARGAGQEHPHRAGEGHPLQGGVHKVQPRRGNILTVDCGEKQGGQVVRKCQTDGRQSHVRWILFFKGAGALKLTVKCNNTVMLNCFTI